MEPHDNLIQEYIKKHFTCYEINRDRDSLCNKTWVRVRRASIDAHCGAAQTAAGLTRAIPHTTPAPPPPVWLLNGLSTPEVHT